MSTSEKTAVTKDLIISDGSNSKSDIRIRKTKSKRKKFMDDTEDQNPIICDKEDRNQITDTNEEKLINVKSEICEESTTSESTNQIKINVSDCGDDAISTTGILNENDKNSGITKSDIDTVDEVNKKIKIINSVCSVELSVDKSLNSKTQKSFFLHVDDAIYL